MTAIFMLIDSTVSFESRYLDLVGGGQDMLLFQKPGLTPLQGPAFDYNSTVQKFMPSVPEIENCFPRLETNAMTFNGSAILFGVDIAYEYKHGIGLQFISLPFGFQLANGLPQNDCIVSYDFLLLHGLTIGSSFMANLPIFATTLNLTVVGIYDPTDRFPFSQSISTPDIVVDLKALWRSVPNFNGFSNTIVVVFKDSDQYYNLQDLAQSQKGIIAIGSQILEKLNVSRWSPAYPKMAKLENVNEFQLLFSTVHVFLSIFAVIFCSILIYLSITTSMAEKIREYGLLQVMGGKKKEIFEAVLLQGLFLGGVSIAVGMVAGIALVYFGLVPLVNMFFLHVWEIPMSVVIVVPMLLFIGCLGFAVILIVSIIPAFRAFQLTLVQEIYPEKSVEQGAQETITPKMKSFNLRQFILGLLLSFTAVFILVFLPQIQFYSNVASAIDFILVILFLFLLGMILIVIGSGNVIFAGVMRLSKPFLGKYSNIVKLGVSTHQRRTRAVNILTILSFCLMSLLISSLHTVDSQITNHYLLQQGSDINLARVDHPFGNNVINELAQIDGIESVSGIFDDLSVLSSIYGSDTAFNISSATIDKSSTVDVHVHAIDARFFQTIYSSITQFQEGDLASVQISIFNASVPNVVISSSLAEALNSHVGDDLVIQFHRNGNVTSITAVVAGVYDQIPGVYRTDFFI